MMQFIKGNSSKFRIWNHILTIDRCCTVGYGQVMVHSDTSVCEYTEVGL